MDAGAAGRIAKLDEVLRGVPFQYAHKDRLRSDVASLLTSCATLTPRTETFSRGGQSVTLFHLYGTLPISYRGSTYNIPVTFYFDPPYPHQAPRCFVTPTPGMALKPNHHHVDERGMIHLPYLAVWNATSSLAELVQFIASVFSEQPPVYATSTTPPPPVEAAARPVAKAVQPQGIVGGIASGIAQAAAQPVPVRPAVPPVAVRGGVAATPVQATPGTSSWPEVDPLELQRRDHKALADEVAKLIEERWPSILEPLAKEASEEAERLEKMRRDMPLESLAKELERLQEQERELLQKETELREIEEGLRTFIEANEGREVDADELRESLDVETQQVLDHLAEEHAHEELLPALDELLAEKKITVTDWLREVRDVSRRQFMCRVARQKAVKTVEGIARGELTPTAVPTPAVARLPAAAVVAAAAASAPPIAAAPQPTAPTPVAQAPALAPLPAAAAPPPAALATREAPPPPPAPATVRRTMVAE